MTFLNLMLLGGATAAAIPLLIHLLNRRRFTRVPWGAMQFLQEVGRTQRRRLRLERIALLVVRAAIPTFLAFCMARPVLTGMRELMRDARTSLVVLLDNSFSMETAEGAETRSDAARALVARMVERLPRGSEVAVLGLAGTLPTLSEPSLNLDRTRSLLTAETGGYGLARVAETLEAAAGVFATRMHQADRELVIVSDFQRVSWGEDTRPVRARALQLLRAQPVPPRLLLAPVGGQAVDYVAVESITLSHSVVGVNQKVRLRASIRNHGASAYPDLRVYFRTDGREREVTQINLPAGEIRQVLFTHAFDTPGSHLVEVQVDADRLKADNVSGRSLVVYDRLPVLIVSGDLSPGALRGESAFLEVALQPFAAAGRDAADLVSARVIAESQLDAGILAASRVVILANVQQLEDAQRAALETFVREGGGLLVFPGDRANLAWWESAAFDGGRGLLPYRMVGLAGSVAADGEQAGIVSEHFDHPALAPFNDPRLGGLFGAQVRLYYRLDRPPETALAETASRVVARLNSGHPFLVEGEYGDGRVLLCCTAADADWSNLPMRAFYLPFIQQMVVYLASKLHPERNVETGDRLAAFLPLEALDQTATLTDPAGQTHVLPVARRELHGLVEFQNTQRPGIYLLHTPAGEDIHFVVSTPVAESAPARLSEAELEALAADMQATLVRSWDDYREQNQERRHGREIWTWLLGLVLVLLFLEMGLVQAMGRRGS